LSERAPINEMCTLPKGLTVLHYACPFRKTGVHFSGTCAGPFSL
jgi:hypothetical protein